MILLFFNNWLPLVHLTVRVELICLLEVYIAIALELEPFVHFLLVVSSQSTSAIPSNQLASALACGLLEYSSALATSGVLVVLHSFHSLLNSEILTLAAICEAGTTARLYDALTACIMSI